MYFNQFTCNISFHQTTRKTMWSVCFSGMKFKENKFIYKTLQKFPGCRLTNIVQSLDNHQCVKCCGSYSKFQIRISGKFYQPVQHSLKLKEFIPRYYKYIWTIILSDKLLFLVQYLSLNIIKNLHFFSLTAVVQIKTDWWPVITGPRARFHYNSTVIWIRTQL